MIYTHIYICSCVLANALLLYTSVSCIILAITTQLFAASSMSAWQRKQMLDAVQAELSNKLRERGLLRAHSTRVRNSGLLTAADIQQALPMVQQNVLADMLAQDGLRMDGRGALDVRPVVARLSPLPVRVQDRTWLLTKTCCCKHGCCKHGCCRKDIVLA